MGLFDEAALQRRVPSRIQQRALGRFAVAARAAGLLVVSLDASRDVRVHDVAHVWLVDAHAERVRRHQHRRLTGNEAPLRRGAVGCGHTGVVRQGAHARRRERCCRLLRVATCARVDDPGLAIVRTCVADEPVAALRVIRHRDDCKPQIGPVEGGHNFVGASGDAETREDVPSHERIRGRRERERARLAEALTYASQYEVVGAEVVAPLGDAVRLVDHEQPHPRGAQPIDEARVREALGRHIQQGNATIDEVAIARVLLRAPDRGVDERRGDARGLQRLDLVLHQRDQRRHDKRAANFERGEHVAQALARAGGHHAEHIARGEPCQHLGLAQAEVGIAEDFVQPRAVCVEVSGERLKTADC
jgi:hypothetical protein